MRTASFRCVAGAVRHRPQTLESLQRQSMLARTDGSEGATEGCGSLLPWHWPCALVVEQLTAALELFGRQGLEMGHQADMVRCPT
jgi:hypothetical protein